MSNQTESNNIEKACNILSFEKERVDVGFDQFTGYCFIVDGKKLLFNGFVFIDAWTIEDWTEERIIVNMCTCTCWECDSIIAEVTYKEDFVIWKIKGYRTNIDYSEFRFLRENYFTVISEMQAEAANERKNSN